MRGIILKTFTSGNFLLPHLNNLKNWAVIACDQFTSQNDYWQKVEETVGNDYSTLHLMLPEIYLNGNYDDRIEKINSTMQKYLNENIFTEYKNAYIYVERTLQNGKIRKGILGCVDLEKYDYSSNTKSLIRPTEKTVLERIPPRQKIRQNAPLELSHILLLCNDEKDRLIEKVSEIKNSLPKLYDFDLMQNGGHIEGYLLQGNAAKEFENNLTLYEKDIQEKYQGLSPMLFAVGDGNHSLCTAKFCYEEKKKKTGRTDLPSRYATVELENIQDEAQEFEPIHRVLKNLDTKKLLQELQKLEKKDGYEIKYITKNEQSVLHLDKNKGELAVAVLQEFLDNYLKNNKGTIDYIHEKTAAEKLVQEDNAIAFLLPKIDKNAFFKSIISNGVLPRKTFSMGHAEEKRYYLEARKIK